jgi:hypothetical protein
MRIGMMKKVLGIVTVAMKIVMVTMKLVKAVQSLNIMKTKMEVVIRMKKEKNAGKMKEKMKETVKEKMKDTSVKKEMDMYIVMVITGNHLMKIMVLILIQNGMTIIIMNTSKMNALYLKNIKNGEVRMNIMSLGGNLFIMNVRISTMTVNG